MNSNMSDSIYNLAQIFKQLPGIGERQAYRIVYDILGRDKNFSENLIESLKKIREKTNVCPECFRHYNNDNIPVCEICGNSKTDKSILMLVERDTDLFAVSRTGLYTGSYFVLGGSIPILEKDPEKKIRAKELKNKIEKSPNIKEIIIATSLTPAGEHTDEYIRSYLKDIIIKNKLQIKSLGRGISTGTEIEYIDAETLLGALKNRS